VKELDELLLLLDQAQHKANILKWRLIADSKEWITVREYAARTGLKPKTVSNYCSQGKIHSVKIDGKHFINITQLP
jgi:hypothetical protein